MATQQIHLFAPTLRPAKPVPGCKLNRAGKRLLARHPGVGGIEAGFPVSGPGDFATGLATIQHKRCATRQNLPALINQKNPCNRSLT